MWTSIIGALIFLGVLFFIIGTPTKKGGKIVSFCKPEQLIWLELVLEDCTILPGLYIMKSDQFDITILRNRDLEWDIISSNNKYVGTALRKSKAHKLIEDYFYQINVATTKKQRV